MYGYQVTGFENFCETKALLFNGNSIPHVGMGLYRVRQSTVVHETVDRALDAGYRLFDTAAVYGNEQMLGSALREFLPKYGLVREDIFVTTKLAPSDYGKGKVKAALTTSLRNLGLEYVDLYLIHFPGAAGIPASSAMNKEIRKETWEEMIELYSQGKTLCIGVSNYTVDHLEEMKEYARYMPMVNQVEWHPYYFQPTLLKYCQKNHIVLQAYCSFGGLSAKLGTLIDEPIVRKIAAKNKLTEAQVLLLWALQQGVCVIPKAVTPSHIRENIDLGGRLSARELEMLNALQKNLKYTWDPSLVS